MLVLCNKWQKLVFYQAKKGSFNAKIGLSFQIGLLFTLFSWNPKQGTIWLGLQFSHSNNARVVTKQTLTKKFSPTSLTTLIATNLPLSHLKGSRFHNRWAECSKLTLLPHLSSSASASIVMLAICFLSQYNFSHFHHMTKRFHKKLTRRMQPWNHDNCSRNITGNKLSSKVVPTTNKTISNFCYITLWVYCNIHFQEVIGATSKYYELMGSHVYHNLYFESVQGTLLIKASYHKGNVVLMSTHFPMSWLQMLRHTRATPLVLSMCSAN
jgi:hypothetical protein